MERNIMLYVSNAQKAEMYEQLRADGWSLENAWSAANHPDNWDERADGTIGRSAAGGTFFDGDLLSANYRDPPDAADRSTEYSYSRD